MSKSENKMSRYFGFDPLSQKLRYKTDGRQKFTLLSKMAAKTEVAKN